MQTLSAPVTVASVVGAAISKVLEVSSRGPRTAGLEFATCADSAETVIVTFLLVLFWGIVRSAVYLLASPVTCAKFPIVPTSVPTSVTSKFCISTGVPSVYVQENSKGTGRCVIGRSAGTEILTIGATIPKFIVADVSLRGTGHTTIGDQCCGIRLDGYRPGTRPLLKPHIAGVPAIAHLCEPKNLATGVAY